LCDIGAGMNAYTGIQEALFAREKTGAGIGVKVSLFDTAADWMTVPVLHAQYGSGAPERAGLNHPSIAPYGGYLTADEEILAISIQNEREWQSLTESILNKPELATHPMFSNNQRRVENRTALDVEINAVFNRKTRTELEKMLRAAKIAYGALNTVDSVLKHPQLRRKEVTLPDGQQAKLIASPIQYSTEDDDAAFSQVPPPGSHTSAIRAEFS